MTANFKIVCGPHNVGTTVTATPSAVRKWVRKICYHQHHRLLRGRLVVGMGVEWVRGGGAATLQLCVGNKCLIFQLLRSDHCPALLRRFLANPDVIFVGLWNYKDVAMLKESRHCLQVGRLVDVREVANDLRGCSRSASMGTMAAEILGLHGLEKDGSMVRSDWNNHRLSKDQVKYVCHDAFLSYLMAKEIRVWNW